jgi:hypothetical protein
MASVEEAGAEVVGERVGQAQRRRQPGAVVARPEHHHGGRFDRPRIGEQSPQRVVGREPAQIAEQLVEQLGKVVVAGPPSQRQHGAPIGARRPADPEVDPAGMKRVQRRVALGDRQRRVVG